MTLLNKTAVGTAHGKIILIGEHAVVYNMPAIALPFMATTTTVTITSIEGETFIDSDYFTGYLSETPEALDGFKTALNNVCVYLNVSAQGLHIDVESLIPPERGMGSSAAVATALVKALFNYFEADLTDKIVKRFVDTAEKVTHGNPSGIDSTIVNSLSPIYFKKDESPTSLPLDMDGFLIAADTGIKGQTKEAVGDVAKLIQSAKDQAKNQTISAVNRIGQLTFQAKDAIIDNNVPILGEIMNQTHRLLKDLTVSNRQLDTLVQSALKAGAAGAKLTGGGRGGCMIALAHSMEHAKKIASELEKAGAIQTWIHPLQAEVGEAFHE